MLLHVATVMLNPSERMWVEYYFKLAKYFVRHMNRSKGRTEVLLLDNNDLYRVFNLKVDR
jgi:hypothetical protein